MAWIPQDVLMARARRAARDVAVRADFDVIKKAASPVDVPIIINNFNRLSYLRALVESLRHRGYENLYVIDNASSFEPLLDYYRSERLKVFHLSRNVGYLALWTTPVFDSFRGCHYAYTDSDVVPSEDCPDDFMSFFMGGLDRYERIGKIGFGLRIDDIPDSYALKAAVVAHEQELLSGEPVGRSFYRAAIDTTFALYRPDVVGASWVPALRTREPYVARHLPWYQDSTRPDVEEMFFRGSARTSTHWSTRQGDSTHEVPLEGYAVRVVAGDNDDYWNAASRGEQAPVVLEAIDTLLEPGASYAELAAAPGATVLYAALKGHPVVAAEHDPKRMAELVENVRSNPDGAIHIRIVVPEQVSARASTKAACEEPAVRSAGMVLIGARCRPAVTLRCLLEGLTQRPATLCVVIQPTARTGLSTRTMFGRIAVAAVLLRDYLGVMRYLKRYPHVSAAPGETASLLWVLRHMRSSLTLVAAERDWPERADR